MIQKKQLPNSLRIISEHIKDVHSASVAVLVAGGSAHETSTNNGIAHFIEHLLFKGTTTRTAHKIAQLIEDYGGNLNAFTEKEYTCYYARVLEDQVPITVDIFCDMLCNSLFDPSEIELERNVILEEIKMYEDTPDEHIYDVLFKSLWGENSFALPITGVAESIQRITREEIIDYVEKFYQPKQIIFSVAGNFDVDEIESHIVNHFSHLTNNDFQINLIKPKPKRDLNVIYKDIEQAHICLATHGVSVDHPDRYPLSIIDIVMAGGISSRLFQEVREKRGLAYSINTYKALYKPAGIFGVYAGMSVNNVNEVLKVVDNEFEVMKNTLLTDEELDRAKKQLKGCMLMGLESMYYRSYRNIHSEFYFNKIYNVETLCRFIDDVTVEDVQRVARYIFNRDYYSLSIIGSKMLPESYYLF